MRILTIFSVLCIGTNTMQHCMDPKKTSVIDFTRTGNAKTVIDLTNDDETATTTVPTSLTAALRSAFNPYKRASEQIIKIEDEYSIIRVKQAIEILHKQGTGRPEHVQQEFDLHTKICVSHNQQQT